MWTGWIDGFPTVVMDRVKTSMKYARRAMAGTVSTSACARMRLGHLRCDILLAHIKRDSVAIRMIRM